MLRINVIAVGKNKERWVEEAIEHYLRLLKKYASVDFVCIPDIKKSRSRIPATIVSFEAEAIRKRFQAGCQIALSHEGRSLTSEQFADYMRQLMNTGGGSVDFIIGGAFGLHPSIPAECRDVISFSCMTISHQLIRPVLLEQLYRAFSILSGGKYHK
jgi:23S rRNA (pseudouridine1915-N3)-methyltransferase